MKSRRIAAVQYTGKRDEHKREVVLPMLFLTSADKSDHLPHSSFLFPELNNIWNELPTILKSCESLAFFSKNLKTYLFNIAFPP